MRRLALPVSVVTGGLSLGAMALVAMAVPWAILSGGAGPDWAGAGWAGLAAAALHLPVAIGTVLGGRLVDRIGPRRMLIGTDGATLLGLAAATAVAAAGAALPWTIAALALAHLAGAPGNIAQDARVPELARLARVPLERANGLRDIAANVGLIGGPAAGVLLVEAAGLAGALAGATALLAVIVILDALFFPRFGPRGRTAGPGGARLIARDPGLRAIVLLGLPIVAIFTALDELIVPSLALTSGLGAGGVTLFLILAAAAGLTASGLFAAYGARLSRRTVLTAGIALTALGGVLLATLPAAWGLRVAPVVLGLGTGPLWPLIVTVLQRRIGPAARGAAIGALTGALLIAQPAAALAAGPLIDLVGVEAVTTGLAALLCLLALAAWRARGLGTLD